MAHKICGKCKKKNGVRTRICECGFEFEIKTKTEDKLISNFEEDQKASANIYGLLYTPSGACPIKPKNSGYDADGNLLEESIYEWAILIKNHGGGRYSSDVAVYWARYFWDIHSPDFKKITKVIVGAWSNKTQDQDFAEI